MIEFVRQIVVTTSEAGRHFELAYGPGGAWSAVFEGCAGFRGATLLRHVKEERRYLVVELWDTEEDRERARAEHARECAELAATLAQWVDSGTEFGVFRVVAEATVKPRSRAKGAFRR